MPASVPLIYDEKKLGELILYIALKNEGCRLFGKVKQQKILFFADFRAYLDLGSPITGAVYTKKPMGPMALAVQPLLERMIQSGDAFVRRIRVPGRRDQEQVLALRAPNLNLFSGPEIAIVDAVIDDLRGLNAREVSDLSHEFRGWKDAAMGSVIPYESVFLPGLEDEDDADELAGAELESIRKSFT